MLLTDWDSFCFKGITMLGEIVMKLLSVCMVGLIFLKVSLSIIPWNV